MSADPAADDMTRPRVSRLMTPTSSTRRRTTAGFAANRHLRPLLRRLLLGKPWIAPGSSVVIPRPVRRPRQAGHPATASTTTADIRKHPDELACIIGRPSCSTGWRGSIPILLGVAMVQPPDRPRPTCSRARRSSTSSCPANGMSRCAGRAGRASRPGRSASRPTSRTPAPAVQKRCRCARLTIRCAGAPERYLRAELIEPIRAHLRANGISFEELSLRQLQGRRLPGRAGTLPNHGLPLRDESQGIACRQHRRAAFRCSPRDRGGLGMARLLSAAGEFDGVRVRPRY